ncbi:hypothetical protein SLA2020_116290 [Shorea laevis]
MVLQKAAGFLVSSNGHAVAEEVELSENIYSNDDYGETASLLAQEMRMLSRSTRGNMLFNQAPADEEIMDPMSTEMVEKMVVVVFLGEQAKDKDFENL